jgi:CRP-like cAMP-binding protein
MRVRIRSAGYVRNRIRDHAKNDNKASAMEELDSLDFTQPAPKPRPTPDAATPAAVAPATPAAKPTAIAPAVTYDPNAAAAFFGEAGTREQVPAGRVFFREREQRGFFSGDDRMYLLVEGSVALTVEGKPIDTVRAGEIFGEMTSLTNSRRSATATAKTDCSVIAIDGGQFRKGIQRKPDFMLMLMSVMVNRFRLTMARLAIKHALPEAGAAEERATFDGGMLKKIASLLDNPSPLRYTAGQTIITTGEPGLFMYFPLEGRVSILNGDKVLSHVGVGSVFGEMSLVDSAARSARVVAESPCLLMAVSRAQFLHLVQAHPEIGLALLKLMAQRLQAATAQASR